jgi:hypothetical protein
LTGGQEDFLTPEELKIEWVKVFFAPLENEELGVTAKFLDFRQKIQPIGISTRLCDAYVILEARVNGVLWPLAEIYCRNGRVKIGSVWADCLAKKIRKAGPPDDLPWLYDAFRKLRKRNGDLVGRPNLHLELTPDLRKVKGLPLSRLLQKSEGWAAAIEEFLESIRNGSNQTP